MQRYENPRGGYAFAAGIAPYSAGVVALPGFEIVHATLSTPLPWRDGFGLVDASLAALGRPRAALCGVELRLPEPLTFDGFAAFNADYRAHLADWELLVDGRNPVARTNVAPAVAAPAAPSLHAFAYTVPTDDAPPTFIVAGAGDLRDQAELHPAAVVRPGETSADALREKARTVLAVMDARLAALGVGWGQVNAVDVYCALPIDALLPEVLLPAIGDAARHGVRWHWARPPIADLAFEMDVRGVRTEVTAQPPPAR